MIALVFIPNKIEIVSFLLHNFTIGLDFDLHIVRKLESYTRRSLGIDNTPFSLVMTKTIVIYIVALKYKLNKTFLYAYFYAIILFYIFLNFDTISIRILRHVLFVEPIMLYYILKQNKNWMFLAIIALTFNIFAKNMVHLERIFY
ncbi:putative membrane protein [Campylobacter californiensis]|nr:putative membrane protein [Campylobacter sp. RM6914]